MTINRSYDILYVLLRKLKGILNPANYIYIYIYISTLIIFPNLAFGDNHYRRHFSIIVDQTPDVQNNAGTQKLFKYLRDSLLLNDESSLAFDDSKDEISLYAFGIDGIHTTPGSYRNIVLSSGGNKEKLYDQFDKTFIQHRGNYSESNYDPQDFLNKSLRPMLSGEDPLAKKIKDNSGITLSKYVYPAILNPSHFDISKPANENIIIIITNFQSGVNDLGTSADSQRLIELVGNNNRLYFEKRFDELEESFYLIPLIKEKFSDGGNHQAQPMIYGNKLALKSLQGISVYIISNLSIVEKGYNATEYKIDNVEIAFNHDNKSLAIDSIVLCVKEDECTIFTERLDDKGKYDALAKSYTFPKMNADLNKVFNVGDTLGFEYLFYARALDDNGNTILPMVFSADREFVFENENIITLLEDRTNMAITIAIILIILALIGWILWRKYTKDGLSRSVDLDFTIIPLSNERFMEVKDRKVLSYDCWYWKNRDQTTDRNIHVIGNYCIEDKKFARKYKYRVEAYVDDLDNNEDFTFRPSLDYTRTNGSTYDLREWVPVTTCNDGPGQFTFDVNAYLDKIETPDFSKLNELTLGLKIRIVMVDNKGNERIMNEVEKTYKFIVRPEIENSDLWIAFDPGTTGSCIAYGIAGAPTDRTDLFLAENESETTANEKVHDNIFPSKIKINKSSDRIFNNDPIIAEELEEGDEYDYRDFIFGNQAVITSRGTNGVNAFQSIKKLLGYTTDQKIIGEHGVIKYIPGKDLAHLIVKGLCNHFVDYLKTNPNIDNDIRNEFLNGENTISAKRAIVAVPNNYTIAKIQEMVDSVKRTNKFEEVHYIYESEAVFMTYLRENWAKLPSLQDKLFLVFDMGGATINATAFTIKVNLQPNSSNIRNIEVTTIGKIGYGIGGDDIDFALIQMLYNIPSIKDAIVLSNYSSTKTEDEILKEHQMLHKEALIEVARELKLKIIDRAKGNNINEFIDVNTFYGHIRAKLGKDVDNDLEIPTEMSVEDKEYLESEDRFRNHMNKYVLSNVTDAMRELLHSIDAPSRTTEVILSGRSVLYPGVKEAVLKQIKESGYICDKEWDGFTENGKVSHQLVKTAVARGACWYAMYSTRIVMHHDILTSTFGFIDTIDNKPKFTPMLMANTYFDENGKKESEKVKPIDQSLANVKFVQMLGHDFDDILDNDIKHKYNILDEVSQRQIVSMIEHIDIAIDDKNNFSFEVKVAGSKAPVKSGRYSGREVKIEITDENSDSYVFSTTNILTLDETVRDETRPLISTSSQNTTQPSNPKNQPKAKSKRF